MILSPFNPVTFRDGAKHGTEEDYIHTFATTDHILIEVIHSVDDELPELKLYEADSDMNFTLSWNTISVNDHDYVSFYELSGLDTGLYYLQFGTLISRPIQILPLEALNNTVLIQYASDTNSCRKDIVSLIKRGIRYFELRFIGGFKDEGWKFGVDNEQFITPDSDIVELFASDYTDKTLTIGASSGVPTWLAELVNRILVSPLVFVNGIRYIRSNDSVPERFGDYKPTQTDYVYTVLLREAQYFTPEIEKLINVTLRRTPYGLRKATETLFRRLI